MSGFFMSNRIDFFQSAQRRLSLPAATVSIFLEGSLCPYLEAIEIVRCGWPEFSWARLAVNQAAYTNTGSISTKEIEASLGMGKSISVQQIYNGTPPNASAFSIPVFAGQIEAIEREVAGEGEILEIMVRDFGVNLERIRVYGQWVGSADGSALFLAGVDTVFNEEGKPNATIEPIEHNGDSLTLFAAQPSQARLWSYAEVIDYLLSRYLPIGQLQTPDIRRLEALTGKQKVRDLDVTGLSLVEALQRCCERTGLKFKFVPRSMPVGPKQAIVFYKNGTSRTVELNYQHAGEQISISKTNISKLHSRKDFWPVTHKYIGQGDFKVYEATFELVKAWDPADENTDYDKFSPSTNPDFYKVKDVYRKWCLNEAGNYSGEPYNQGEAFDFSKIFGSSNFALRRRRFYPALSTDKQDKSLGYYLQVSLDNGLHWRQYLGAFENQLDECGVWLSSDRLDVETWVAALKGVLKFRITASVVSDERLSCVVADGPIDSVVPVVEHIITLPRQFKHRKVSNQSIFANVYDGTLGEPDEVDDSTALYGFIRQRTAVSSEPIGTIEVQIPYLAFDYQVADIVTSSPESRDLLDCKSDNRSISWIKRVCMNFEKQCTDLIIVRQRRALL